MEDSSEALSLEWNICDARSLSVRRPGLCGDVSSVTCVLLRHVRIDRQQRRESVEAALLPVRDDRSRVESRPMTNRSDSITESQRPPAGSMHASEYAIIIGPRGHRRPAPYARAHIDAIRIVHTQSRTRTAE